MTLLGDVYQRMFDAYKLLEKPIPYMRIEAWDTDRDNKPSSYLIQERDDSYNTWIMYIGEDGKLPEASVIADRMRGNKC